MKNKKELLIGLLVVIDLILSALLVFFGIGLLRNVVGYDIVIYENWYGTIDDPTVYRFGAGCWEYTICIVKFILLTGLQIYLAKKHRFRLPFLIIGLFLHLLILAAGIYYVFQFGDGECILLFINHFIYGIDY